ncbi:argininosuccinate lyase [Terriglobus roseus DSM 18391]|uniref:Argininosuccinate lyase n=1 Tax=Terriglobus roseus (strain DSM 18391 / NRRL B-41598 / KBS 63) TaxID=926566 RepID=I3ZFJ1_TERRK|nr:argininosuccinate lyase [Terriglobus roseus]AFL88009.1 argininosuccinate lyase [Terriglobus roseus DSM 18391]
MSNEPTKMWSGRFREPLNKAFEQWQRSFPFDWRLIPQEIAASTAHAKTIAAANILTSEELAQIVDGLRAIGENFAAGSLNVATDVPEDVHHFLELELQKRVGTVALKLHTGRSRNEQIATDLRLYVRDAIDRAVVDLKAWAAALLELAKTAGEHAMPSYTHLQRAEPVLVAHWLMAYFEMAVRDISRLQDARARMNFCPLGSGPIAGATLALDRTIAARELGFTAPTANSMDATSDRDFALEFAQVAATIGLHLSRFAEEITLHATAEFGFVDLPEAFSTGSSAMPQKKNPDLTELVRGKSGRLLGAATTFATILKGLPLAYNKDMQETQEATFEVAETFAGMLPLMAPFTAALQFRYPRMEEAAQSGYLNAMAAATYLVYKGVPFRTAHEKIGNAVRFGLDSGRELNELSVEELKKFGDEFGEDFHAAVTLKATLDCHDVIGGTAVHRVAEALAAAGRRLSALETGAARGI